MCPGRDENDRCASLSHEAVAEEILKPLLMISTRNVTGEKFPCFILPHLASEE